MTGRHIDDRIAQLVRSCSGVMLMDGKTVLRRARASTSETGRTVAAPPRAPATIAASLFAYTSRASSASGIDPTPRDQQQLVSVGLRHDVLRQRRDHSAGDAGLRAPQVNPRVALVLLTVDRDLLTTA